MSVDDVIAAIGHQVHLCRPREAGTLLRWLGPDLRGRVLLDVAGGDGYWAGRARRRGARALSVDLAGAKLRRGRRLRHAPVLLAGDALRLPVADESVDAVLSVCALEHFTDGPAALAEMSRVLRPGGLLGLSADALTLAARWPSLARAHRRRFAVLRTYQHTDLTAELRAVGLEVQRHSYQFRAPWSQLAYLLTSAYGGGIGFTLTAPLAPLVAASDARQRNTRGSVVLVLARKS